MKSSVFINYYSLLTICLLFVQCSDNSHSPTTSFLMSLEHQNLIELEQNNELKSIVAFSDSLHEKNLESALRLIDSVKMELIIHANKRITTNDFSEFNLKPTITYYDLESPEYSKNLEFLVKNFPNLKKDINLPIEYIIVQSLNPKKYLLLSSPCEDPYFPDEKTCSEENYFLKFVFKGKNLIESLYILTEYKLHLLSMERNYLLEKIKNGK